ncbi:MAG: beta-ketoacyl-[acyl-carrier-protein] synthase family protein [Sandaracinaceae bacterium]
MLTPLADAPEAFFEALIAGRSAVTRWRTFADAPIYSKVGADLGDYDLEGAVRQLEGAVPMDVWDRLRKLSSRAPWGTSISMLGAVRAAKDAGWLDDPVRPDEVASLVAGHNLNARYIHAQQREFADEPDFIDGLMSVSSLDTDHAGCVSEVLGTQGPIYTIGGACASGGHAMRAALDELRHHGMKRALCVGAALDFSPVDLHAMALLGAISFEGFNDAPAAASRPFDVRREGFVPAHGSAAIALEDWEHAEARGARILAELVAVGASSDANHLPNPSVEGQHRLMKRTLERASVVPEQIDYVNAHATSTPLGDVTEIESIRRTFGKHATRLKINAPKSMLGHCCWSAPIVETVAAVLQMQRGQLHPSINVETLDPAIDLDVCADGPVSYPVGWAMKNAFGFGGINVVSLLRHPEAR